MSHPSIYLAARNAETHTPLLRRELCWLLKDQAAAADGWGIPHGIIDPFPPRWESTPSFLEHQEVSAELSEGVEEAIRSFAGESGCFIAPYEYDFDEKYFCQRLAGTSAVAKLESLSDVDSIRPYDVVSGFWANEPQPTFFNELIRHAGGAFNMAHPYRGGFVYDVTDEQGYELKNDGFRQISDEDAPIFTLLLSTTSLEGEIDRLTEAELLNRIPKGTSRSPENHANIQPKFNMSDVQSELDISSAATCGGSVLVRARADDEAIPRLTNALDVKGFGIAGMTAVDGDCYLLYKMKPRHSDLHDLRPPFDPAFEHRKMALTEWSRDAIPGHREFGGDRRTVLDSFEGWQIIAEKPGRKDADDFIALIEGPGEIELEFLIDKAPFETIFGEIRANAQCPESGEAFMDAVYQLYLAQATDGHQLATEITDLAEALPPHSNPEDLRYPNRRAFLWLLALLFIVEDINYRFSFHGILAGRHRIAYRKQGRDQPMNALLQSVANLDTSLEEQAEQAEGSGDLPNRPTTFNGPDHLADWFAEHILEN